MKEKVLQQQLQSEKDDNLSSKPKNCTNVKGKSKVFQLQAWTNEVLSLKSIGWCLEKDSWIFFKSLLAFGQKEWIKYLHLRQVYSLTDDKCIFKLQVFLRQELCGRICNYVLRITGSYTSFFHYVRKCTTKTRNEFCSWFKVYSFSPTLKGA